MNKKNIIQFLPYFPPHKGGLESHAAQWGKWWIFQGYGKVYNVITSIDQHILLGDEIIFEGKKIGYLADGVENLIVPSLEIIPNFPVYKVWSKEYKLIVKYLKGKTSLLDFEKNSLQFSEETSPQPSPQGEGVEQFVLITRTRFFVTSFVGGLFARKNKIEWCHIEHGSDYVKLNSGFKNFVAKIYDKLIGKWIFKNADKIVGVSNACKKFIQKEFVNRKVDVIYRGLEFNDIKTDNTLKEKFSDKIIVGFLGRLYKWKNIETLIEAFYDLDDDIKNKIQIVIVGDGEDFDRLKELDFYNKIYFTGGVSFQKALEYQKQFDIHFHTSSPGGGLATTLLQAMYLGCLIVSTPYEGANEVIENGKNGILLVDDSEEELKRGLEKGIEMINKKEEFSLINKNIIDNSFVWEKNIEKYFRLFK